MSVVLAARTELVGADAAALLVAESVVRRCRSAVFQLEVTANQTAGSDTLDVWLQHSIDGSTWDDFVRFAQVAGNATPPTRLVARWVRDVTPTTPQGAQSGKGIAAGVVQGPTGSLWRAAWTVTEGNDASFTFGISASLHLDGR